MHRTLLSFIISISLFAAFSAEAQERTDWALKAAECERVAFYAEDPRDAAEALAEKAFCYRQCGRYEEALATLERIGLYQLPPERVDEVLYEKELCSYLAGDWDGAASYMEEAGASSAPRRLLLDALVLGGSARWEESLAKALELVDIRYEGEEREAAALELRDLYGRVPKLKKENRAVLRSFLPPLGHSYTGHLSEGLIAAGFDAAAVGWIVWQCLGGNWITGILGGGVVLNAAFMGGMERSISLVDEYNRDALAGFNAVLQDVLHSHEIAE